MTQRWWKRRHCWVTVLLSQEDKSQSQQTVKEISLDPSVVSFADYSQRYAPVSAARKRCAQQLTEANSSKAYLLRSRLLLDKFSVTDFIFIMRGRCFMLLRQSTCRTIVCTSHAMPRSTKSLLNSLCVASQWVILVCSLIRQRDNWNYMKTEAYEFYSRVFWIFLPCHQNWSLSFWAAYTNSKLVFFEDTVYK